MAILKQFKTREEWLEERRKGKILARFDRLCIPEPNSGCWLWLGALHVFGYGKFGLHEKIYHAHRIAWQLLRGRISSGLQVLHKCDNPSCVNPDHLFLGTQKDNIHDMWQKGRAVIIPAQEALRNKTHCKRGHPRSTENIYTRKNGGKQCRVCHKQDEKNRRIRNR